MLRLASKAPVQRSRAIESDVNAADVTIAAGVRVAPLTSPDSNR
jgi:hypothetical protein